MLIGIVIAAGETTKVGVSDFGSGVAPELLADVAKQVGEAVATAAVRALPRSCSCCNDIDTVAPQGRRTVQAPGRRFPT